MPLILTIPSELSIAGPTRPADPQCYGKADQKVRKRDDAEPRKVMVDDRLSRTYFKGRPTSAEQDIKNAPQLRFGIYYLPGTDIKDVERAKLNDLSRQEPDQLPALWKINTAGSLLNEVFIRPDLLFELKDRTRDILSNTSSWLPDEHRAPSFMLLSCCTQRKAESQSLATSFACTIDSSNVKLLNPF
jgi:hypothetical protein